jgi:hypothetical protein
MMITGSNSWGEALPPLFQCMSHFQFMTMAQTERGIQIHNEAVLFTHNVIGQFGLDEEIS